MKRLFKILTMAAGTVALAVSPANAVLFGTITVNISGTLSVPASNGVSGVCSVKMYLLPTASSSSIIANTLSLQAENFAVQKAQLRVPGPYVASLLNLPSGFPSSTTFNCSVNLPYNFVYASPGGVNRQMVILYSVFVNDAGYPGQNGTYNPPTYPGGDTTQTIVIQNLPGANGTNQTYNINVSL